VRLLLFTIALILPALGQITVVIDPGHGGVREKKHSDGSQEGDGSSWNNAHSAKYNFLEKDLCLTYSQEIAKALSADPRAQKLGINPILTRKDDRHLSAMTRAAYAVEYGARVFLSIHFNGSNNSKAQGTRAYYCSEQHPNWEYMHFVNPYADRDKAFGKLLVKEVANSLKPLGAKPELAKVLGDRKGDGGHLKDGIRTLGFARQDTHMYQAVVILLEIEFIDNPQVAEWLLGPKTRDTARESVAKAVTTAICQHLETDTPPKAPRKAR